MYFMKLTSIHMNMNHIVHPHLGDLVHGSAPRLEGHPDGAGHVREEPRRHLLERLPVDPLTQVDLLLYMQIASQFDSIPA